MSGDEIPARYIRESAVVSGIAAHVLDRLLASGSVLELTEGLASRDPHFRAEWESTRRAIARAAAHYERRPVMSADGPADTGSADIARAWPDEINVATAAALLGVSARHVRRLAAAGLGRRLGRAWLLDRTLTVAYRERRRAS